MVDKRDKKKKTKKDFELEPETLTELGFGEATPPVEPTEEPPVITPPETRHVAEEDEGLFEVSPLEDTASESVLADELAHEVVEPDLDEPVLPPEIVDEVARDAELFEDDAQTMTEFGFDVVAKPEPEPEAEGPEPEPPTDFEQTHTELGFDIFAKHEPEPEAEPPTDFEQTHTELGFDFKKPDVHEETTRDFDPAEVAPPFPDLPPELPESPEEETHDFEFKSAFDEIADADTEDFEETPEVVAPQPPVETETPETETPEAAAVAAELAQEPVNLDTQGETADMDEPAAEPKKPAAVSPAEVKHFRPHVLLAALATGLEIAAVCVGLGYGTAGMLILAALGHVGAAALSLWAAKARRKELSDVEKDLILLTSVFIPVFGPAMAWVMPHATKDETIQNAHAVFESYADHVKPAAPDYERTLFTGDYARDMARELDCESYHEVLRHGSTDQKRNALVRLADLGMPRHFRLVRHCLLDPEHEVRLYAYNELDRAARGYEQTIAKRSKQVEKGERDAEALLALAQAYFDYAASGIQDMEMAAFYFRSAERFACEVMDNPEAVWLRASALARLKEFEAAEQALAALPPQAQANARSCVVRADIAFRRRDFASARAEAATIRATGAELPDWLAALEESTS